MTQDKTIARILKVLALAEGKGTTEGEAQAALAMAQRLMAEANLTMAELEAAGRSAGEGSARVEDSVESRSPYPWKRQLMAAIAQLNSVYCIEQYDYSKNVPFFKGYRMIGREANVASTRVMFDYLLEAVTRVQREYAGQDRTRWVDRDSFIFKEACCRRIVERLDAQRYEEIKAQRAQAEAQRARQAADGSNLPVVVMEEFYQSERDLNNDLLYGWEPGTTARRRAEAQAKESARKTREDDLVAGGMDRDVAELVTQGYSIESATETVKKWKKADERAAKRGPRFRTYTKAERAESVKRSSPSYRAGYEAGSTVSLSRQADHQAKPQIE